MLPGSTRQGAGGAGSCGGGLAACSMPDSRGDAPAGSQSGCLPQWPSPSCQGPCTPPVVCDRVRCVGCVGCVGCTDPQGPAASAGRAHARRGQTRMSVHQAGRVVLHPASHHQRVLVGSAQARTHTHPRTDTRKAGPMRAPMRRSLARAPLHMAGCHRVSTCDTPEGRARTCAVVCARLPDMLRSGGCHAGACGGAQHACACDRQTTRTCERPCVTRD
jgi:hypothetical protein